MSSYLSKILAERLGTEDYLNQDFPLPEHLISSDINYKKVRGNVRLMIGRAITPDEVEMKRRKVYGFRFF